MSQGQYTQHLFPWQGVKTAIGFDTRRTLVTKFGMGDWYNSPAGLSNEFTFDLWLDAGTWKIAIVYESHPQAGVMSFQLDGVTQGTVDGYNAGGAVNLYAEVAGVSVTTAGLKTFKVLMATKNASSSGYYAFLSSIALIRTGGTGATGTSSDAPGSTIILIPWMGVKASVGAWARSQNSGDLGGGYFFCTNVQGSSISWDVWLDAGTYTYAVLFALYSGAGIESVKLNGTVVGTVDEYTGGATTHNNYGQVTGIIVATAGIYTLTIASDTKNGASSGYALDIHSVALIKTA